MARRGDDVRVDVGDLKNICENGDKDDVRDLHQRERSGWVIAFGVEHHHGH